MPRLLHPLLLLLCLGLLMPQGLTADYPAVRINEFMASNGATMADEDGDFEDWIELHNPSASPVDLSHWGLSDNASNPFKWTFPEDTVIDAGGYLLVWASGKDRAAADPVPGILREVWTNIPGAAVADLTSHPAFPDRPDFRNLITSSFEAPRDIDDHYGQRMHGLLTVPATGAYRFWISSDDNGELHLAADGDPANTTVIASVPGWTNPLEWNKYPSQTSAPVALSAGQVVYLAALMKEAAGGDNLAVRWQLPDGTFEEPIPAHRFTSPHPGQLHTNFRIASAGEPLSLTRPDGQTIDQVDPVYLPRDVSFGRLPDAGDNWHYFDQPTPGAANTSEPVVLPPAVSISEPRGFKTAPFSVSLTASEPGAVIRYTVDGSEPDENSPVYQQPLTVGATTTLRASAWAPGMVRLPPATVTYLFLDDILLQDSAPPPGWPADREINNHAMEYGLRPQIVDSDEQRLRAGLADIPSISLVTDLDHLFHPQTGIYSNSNRTHGAERPVSVELIDPDGNPEREFHIDAGLRLRGAFSRSVNNPKHSFRLLFRSAYGENRLQFPLFDDEGADEFHKVDLRTAQNYSWAFQNDNRNTFLREVFSRDSQRDMGMPHTRSRYYHLYLNGQYWGLYQTQERGDSDWAATYLGGDSDDWDTIKTSQPGYVTEASDGDFDAFNALHDIAVNQGFTGANAGNYQLVRGLNPDGTPNPGLPVYLDEDNLINYMLVTHYVGDRDAPVSLFMNPNRPNNMYALIDRIHPGGFKWLRHDAEHSLGAFSGEGVDWDPTFIGQQITAQNHFNPATLNWRLLEHPDYRMRFADLVHRHLFNDGALTPENARARVLERKQQIDLAIIGESARWGRGRTRDGTWIPAVNNVLAYLDQRRDFIVAHYRNRGWYPDFDPPRFSFGQDQVRVSAATPFYYMTDGSDPRLPGGGVRPQAILVQGGGEGPQTLVPRGATWRYFDLGSEPEQVDGLDWRQPGYPDAGWQSGPAVLGFAGIAPTNPVATITRRWVQGSSGPQVNATYLRHRFTVESPEAVDGLLIEILRDDGAVVHLNGVEILRENMPPGPITYDTLAASVVGGENQTTYFVRAADVAHLLQAGDNVLAVSVHQINATSSDLYFDLSLAAKADEHAVTLPWHQATALTARATAEGDWSAIAEASSLDLLPPGATVHHFDFDTDDPDMFLQPSRGLIGGQLTFDPGPATAVLRNESAQGFDSAHLRVNDPVGTVIHLALPTTGYQHLQFSYLTRRSGQGAGLQTVEFTTDGNSWNSLDTYHVQNDPPRLRTHSLVHLAAANDNPDFAVRITIAQGDGGPAGNQRFDDFILTGIPMPGLHPAPAIEQTPDDLVLVEQGAPLVIPLTGVFSYSGEHPPGFSADLEHDGLAGITADPQAGTLTITPQQRGGGGVTVVADDGRHLPVATSFRLLVHPRAHRLSTGPWQFDHWDQQQPAQSYPAHMMFLQGRDNDSTLETALVDAYHIPTADAANAGDVQFPYRASSRTRINGLGADGIAFINTGRGRDLGGALLALDTTGIIGAEIGFTAGTVLPNSRVYALRLQYRIGTSGPFTDLTGEDGAPIEYVRDTDTGAGHEKVFEPVPLPGHLLGQPYLQLLWRYHLVDGDSGARAMLRLDDIEVVATPITRFQQWQALHFTDPGDLSNPAVSGPLAVSDNGQVSNLERYAFDLAPARPAAPRLPGLGDDGDSFRWWHDPRKTDLDWLVRGSEDLLDWDIILWDSRTDTAPGLDSPGWLQLPIPPPAPGTRLFLKLELLWNDSDSP